jgi:hypothetical protein
VRIDKYMFGSRFIAVLSSLVPSPRCVTCPLIPSLVPCIMPSVFRRRKSGSHVHGQANSGLIPEDEIIPVRRPYGSKNLRLSFEGRVSTSVGMFTQVLAEEEPSAGGNDVSSPTAIVMGKVAEANVDGSEEDLTDVLAREKRAVKRQQQWRKWSEDVIPALLHPYMALLRETQGLQNIDSKRQPSDSCAGCSGGRLLAVTCVYFQSRMISFVIFLLFFC